MTIHSVPLDSHIETKIAWANDCRWRKGEALLTDPAVARLLESLNSAIRDSRRTMAQAGIVEECGNCEQKRGGSCCGLGLENYYSGNLLLINLLLDVELPDRRSEPRSCFFLGPRGCLLAARHVICINYLCEEVTSRINPSRIAELREKEGVEVNLLFQLNERLLKVLHGETQGSPLHP
ncbi:MAG: hypothetical protein JXL84_21975 [Deltaproteobacteria bacterium]|nr:hypothetical protein [Deltaproteobacteria bacterium]